MSRVGWLVVGVGCLAAAALLVVRTSTGTSMTLREAVEGTHPARWEPLFKADRPSPNPNAISVAFNVVALESDDHLDGKPVEAGPVCGGVALGWIVDLDGFSPGSPELNIVLRGDETFTLSALVLSLNEPQLMFEELRAVLDRIGASGCNIDLWELTVTAAVAVQLPEGTGFPSLPVERALHGSEPDSIRIGLPLTEDPILEGELSPGFPVEELVSDGWLLELTIDLDTGRINRWPPAAGGAWVNVKAQDAGSYEILDAAGEVIVNRWDYVPHGVVPGDFGDYVRLQIDSDGVITNWPDEVNLAEFGLN